VFNDDLPVFISTDAILHAWHRSYASMLQELEETLLISSLQAVLEGMRASLPDFAAGYGDGVLAQSIVDAEHFLAVAAHLLSPASPPASSEHMAAVRETLDQTGTFKLTEITLYGEKRQFDFSQFIVRGHYTRSPTFGNYFRSIMWLGLADFRIVSVSERPEALALARRQLGTALVLNELLKRSGTVELWKNVDSVVEMFVGRPDSLGFDGLQSLLEAVGVDSIASIKTEAALESIQDWIITTGAGRQEILGHVQVFPPEVGNPKLPQSFAFLGRRFVVDSWVLGKMVFPYVPWVNPDGGPRSSEMMRRIPSGLDLAFGVLANSHTTPLLVERILSGNGLKFRDGIQHQRQLAAAREVVQLHPLDFWTENIYSSWLGAIRELSNPTTSRIYPEAMRTRAWGDKNLNTQLASWTQLRHDTVLYTKQTYTGIILCFYPAGYVEPRIEFWHRLREMAIRSAQLVKALSPASASLTRLYPDGQDVLWSQAKANQISFLHEFASTLTWLIAISHKELAQQALSVRETSFLRSLVERQDLIYVGKVYSGWYHKLFYATSSPYTGASFSDIWDPVVTDVHTDPPNSEVGDPGGILHEAVGGVNMMLIAVDNGPDRMVYAGPVLSHHEFLTKADERLTDELWDSRLRGAAQPSPEWTRSYLVPAR
jgi:hypothetical protein